MSQPSPHPSAPPVTALRVALDPRVADVLPEVKYTFRTLLAIAGYGCHFVWAGEGVDAEIVYGDTATPNALLRIPRADLDFRRAASVNATGVRHASDLPWLVFPGEAWHGDAPPDTWPTDVIFAAFWLLTGAVEPSWPRDRWDNLGADDFVLVREQLLTEAPVSRWAARLRAFFAATGRAPLDVPWATGGTHAAFAFTHDVDYPEIIRWIEAPRLLLRRGVRGIPSAVGVLRGTNHFWTFREWIELQARVGARPTFYFMARQGSLLQYAMGRPDDFYDIRTPAFQRLFGELRDAGCEIGLHASYLSHRSAEMLRVEAERVSHAAGVPMPGNRHHYWHLDPADPNETLRRHELAGIAYDSSLGLEFFPGFRRGTCHPFHVFHTGERRPLDIVQVPPAWMDDHFDRRLPRNGITDPDAVGRRILATLRATGGVGVVDYHSRGMNADFYPRYGPWLARFVEANFDATLAMRTPREVVAEFRAHEAALAAVSVDDAAPRAPAPEAPVDLVVGPVTASDTHDVAALHHDLFGDPDFNGYSMATLGARFLDEVFYALNLGNPHLHALVARADGRVVGFSVYATDRHRAMSHAMRHHPLALATRTARALASRPAALRTMLGNLRYARSEPLPFLDGVPGWWVVAGVHPDARSPRMERRMGGRVAARLFDTMESDMRARGCPAWYGVVRPDNAAINTFLQRRGAREAGMGSAQGMAMRYYVKRFEPADPVTR